MASDLPRQRNIALEAGPGLTKEVYHPSSFTPVFESFKSGSQTLRQRLLDGRQSVSETSTLKTSKK